MTYPNAFAGVKKLVAAEALQIISAGLGIIAAILGAAALTSALDAAMSGSEASAAGFVGAGIGTVLCSIGILVLGIIATIFTLIGLKKCSADEPKNFNIAFFAAIAVLVLGVLAGVLTAVPVIANIMRALSSIANACVFVFTVTGISELAQKLNRADLVNLGKTILILMVAGSVLSIVGTFVSGVFAIISAIVSLVCYIAYLVYLTKAKAMLESN